MLIINRREGERFRLLLPDGDTIWVQILNGGSNMRVGITAALDVLVHREEILPKEEWFVAQKQRERTT